MPILTVTTGASWRGLVTLPTLKEELDITGAAQDGKLRRRILEFSDAIAAYCGLEESQTRVRTFAREILSVTYDATEINARDAGALYLPYRTPLVSINSVTADGVAVAASGYEIDYSQGALYRLDTSGDRTIWDRVRTVIGFTAGWDLEAEAQPTQLQRAIIELIRIQQSATARDPALKREVVPGILEQEFWVGTLNAQFLPADILDLINPFKRTAVAAG